MNENAKCVAMKQEPSMTILINQIENQQADMEKMINEIDFRLNGTDQAEECGMNLVNDGCLSRLKGIVRDNDNMLNKLMNIKEVI
jgi:hypothetical protein